MNRPVVIVVLLVLLLDWVAWLRGGGRRARGRSGSWSQCMREAKEGSSWTVKNSERAGPKSVRRFCGWGLLFGRRQRN